MVERSLTTHSKDGRAGLVSRQSLGNARSAFREPAVFTTRLHPAPSGLPTCHLWSPRGRLCQPLGCWAYGDDHHQCLLPIKHLRRHHGRPKRDARRDDRAFRRHVFVRPQRIVLAAIAASREVSASITYVDTRIGLNAPQGHPPPPSGSHRPAATKYSDYAAYEPRPRGPRRLVIIKILYLPYITYSLFSFFLSFLL